MNKGRMSMWDPDNAHDKARVMTVWNRAKADPVFRMRLLADPEETLKGEGFDENDEDFKGFVNNLKTVDLKALEAGLRSGEKNPTC